MENDTEITNIPNLNDDDDDGALLAGDNLAESISEITNMEQSEARQKKNKDEDRFLALT